MPRPISPTSVEQRVLTRLRKINRAAGLTLTSPDDLAFAGDRTAVDFALHRLTAQGTIRRLSRGLYYIPKIHPVLGEIRPNPDAIVRALTAKHRLRTQPSGAYAANLLGLSDQVPMRLVYLTDGASRRFRVGKQEIVLKRTTPKNMATAGRISGLVIQAFRYLGQRQVDPSTADRLRSQLSAKDRKQLLKDAPLAPAWIAARMREIAGGVK